VTPVTHVKAWPKAIIMILMLCVGCSSGGAADHPVQSEPTVSTPADETPTPAPANDDFATAVKFTKLTHANKQRQANGLVVPESPAARYLVYQVKIDKAQSIAGVDQSDDQAQDHARPGRGHHQNQVRHDRGRPRDQLHLGMTSSTTRARS
jgi:hypothetical protein